MNDRSLQDAMTEQSMLKADSDNMRHELMLVWRVLHYLVKQTRNSSEHTSPGPYRSYDEICSKFGETPVQATVGGEGHIK